MTRQNSHPHGCPCPTCLDVRVWLASQAGDVTERLEATEVLDIETAELALAVQPEYRRAAA